MTSEINKIENRYTIICKVQIWFFEKVDKTDKLLVRLNKKKREEVQINNMRNKEGTSTDATENNGGTLSIFFKNKRILYITLCH